MANSDLPHVATTAWVRHDVTLGPNVHIANLARIIGPATITAAQIGDRATVTGPAHIDGAALGGDAHVRNSTLIGGTRDDTPTQVIITGNAHVIDSWISGPVHVPGEARIYSGARIDATGGRWEPAGIKLHPEARIGAYADIRDSGHVHTATTTGRPVTFYRTYPGPDGDRYTATLVYPSNAASLADAPPERPHWADYTAWKQLLSDAYTWAATWARMGVTTNDHTWWAEHRPWPTS